MTPGGKGWVFPPHKHLEIIGKVPVLVLDFIILTKVSVVLFQLSEWDTTLGKKTNQCAFM